MPRKPKKPCAYPGCPNLTDGRYCSLHEKRSSRAYDKQQEKKYDRQRSAVHRKRYDRRWTEIRNIYFKTHPICERCYSRGAIIPAEHVHHILPLSEGGQNAPDNLMSLCRKCHMQIHIERGDRFGWMKAKPKAEVPD